MLRKYCANGINYTISTLDSLRHETEPEILPDPSCKPREKRLYRDGMHSSRRRKADMQVQMRAAEEV